MTSQAILRRAIHDRESRSHQRGLSHDYAGYDGEAPAQPSLGAQGPSSNSDMHDLINETRDQPQPAMQKVKPPKLNLAGLHPPARKRDGQHAASKEGQVRTP